MTSKNKQAVVGFVLFAIPPLAIGAVLDGSRGVQLVALGLVCLAGLAIMGDVTPRTITTPADAREWLAWARANHHPDSCQCHGCVRAREILRSER